MAIHSHPGDLLRKEQLWHRCAIEAALLAEHRPIVWLTLNFNRRFGLQAANTVREKFIRRVHRALFRASRYSGVCTSELMRIIASAGERCRNGNPHFHMLVALTADQMDKFERRAPILWQRLARSGDLHVERAGKTPDDAGRLAQYVTKSITNSQVPGSFTRDETATLPPFGGPLKLQAEVHK